MAMYESEFEETFPRKDETQYVPIPMPPEGGFSGEAFADEGFTELEDIKAGRSSIFSKILVVSCVLSIYAFVVTSFWFFYMFGAVPDSLNYTFLPAIFGQLGVMSQITRKDKDVEIAYLRHAAEVAVAKINSLKAGV